MAQAKQTPAAPVVSAPSFDKTAVAQAAQTLASADKAFTSAVGTVAQQVARVLTASPDYSLWQGVKSAFVADYTTARQCEAKTAENRWSFVAAELKAQFALEAPRKPTEGAQAKAAQRTAKQARVDALIAKHPKIQDLMEAAKKAPKAQVDDYGDAIAKATRTIKADAAGAAREAEKALREEGRKILGALTEKALEKAIAALRKCVPADKLAEVLAK